MNAVADTIDIVSEAEPVAVGGVGGSGTRIVAHLLRELGFDIGDDLNESLDDLCFTALFKRAGLRDQVGSPCYVARTHARARALARTYARTHARARVRACVRTFFPSLSK